MADGTIKFNKVENHALRVLVVSQLRALKDKGILLEYKSKYSRAPSNMWSRARERNSDKQQCYRSILEKLLEVSQK